jgi:Immunoglobulin domain/FG-GAP-like repeat/Matrixin
MRAFRFALVSTLLVSSVFAYDLDRDDNGYVNVWDPGTITMKLLVPTSGTNWQDGSTYSSSIKAAMDSWNGLLGIVQFNAQITNTAVNPPSGTYRNGNGTNEIVVDSKYGGQTFGDRVLAITLSFTDNGNSRSECDIVFNSSVSWDSFRGGAFGTKQDIRRVAIHELGHVLGLNHPDQATPPQSVIAVMNSVVSYQPISPGVYIDKAQLDDITGAQLLYGPPGVLPPNDNFVNATSILVTSSSVQVFGSNVGASAESGETAHAGANAPNRHSVWWKWHALSSGSATITTLGSDFDTVLAVYTGSSVSSLGTEVASNDDVTMGVVRTSTVTFDAAAGTTYYIAVDGWGSTTESSTYTYTGAITLNVNFSGPIYTLPTFTTEPSSQSAVEGYPITLAAAASAKPDPTFQWQKNGANIAGATGSSYTISSVSPGDAGSYQVVATNDAGSTTSDAAVLTVVSKAAAINITGDFDGDLQSDLVWQNTLTGERSIWLMDGTTFKLGVGLGTFAPDWTIVATGDFNHDGHPDLVWQNTITGQRSIWLMNGTALSLGVDLGTYSTDLMIAATGDFNGDGQSDLVWQNTITGERSIWLMNGTTKVSEVSLGVVPTAWSIAGTGDFNGDGKPDLVWQNAATGERTVWLMDGTTKTSVVSLGIVPKQFQIVGTGDYNHDLKTDLVLTDLETGERLIWLMDGTTHVSTVSVATISLEWSLGRPIFLTAQTAHADFNADGQTDIIWQNSTTGDRSISLMNGTTLVSTVSLGTFPAEWVISGAGDFNNDEKPDLVWTNTTTGERTVWLMDGTTKISTVPLATVPGYWLISAIGDFNFDGKPDLVWTNTLTGERSIWLLNGTVFGSGVSLGTIPTAWKIGTTADMNGDGKTDLVWQNTSTGERSVWLMNGGIFTAGLALDTLPVQWSIVGSGDFNGDGKADLLLENTVTGEKVVRLMDHTTFLSTVSLGTFDTHLSIKN